MIKKLLAFGLIAVLIFSCNTERILPDSSGAPGELIVVMDPVHWEGEPGKAVRALFGQAVQGLPQREGRFTILNYASSNFPSMLQTHRNIFMADIGAEFEKAGVGNEYERWSKRQQVVQLVAPNESDWLKVLNQEGTDIIELYERSEIKRLQHQQRKLKSKDHALKVKDTFGFTMVIPKDFQLAKAADSFAHFRRDRVISSKSKDGQGFSQMGHQVIDGIFVYRYPYRSDSTFTRFELMNQRDSITKYNVPGQREGSYMSIQRFFEELDLRPSMRETVVDSTFATEMKGLWGMVNARMGGPFISVSFVAPDGKDVIAVEGYCHAPQFDKREFLRYVEAIVYSIEFAE